MKRRYTVYCLLLIAAGAVSVGVWKRPVSLPPTKTEKPASKPPSDKNAPAPKPTGGPVDRFPLLTAAAPRSPEAFRARYDWVSGKYKEAANAGGGGFMSKFAYEKQFYIRETRLLALTYPDLVEPAWIAIAKNPQSDPLDLSFALWGLRFLAMKGRSGALSALLEVASTANKDLRDDAIYHLTAVDDRAAYRTTYYEACRLGVSSAFDVLSTVADGSTRTFAEDLLRSAGNARGEAARLRIEASKLLERQTLLISGDWVKRATDLLEEDQGSNNVTWALRSGRVNGLPGMLDILRRRLDRAEDEAKLSMTRYSPGTQKEMPDSAIQFVTFPNPLGLRDKAFDEVLVAYAEMGGSINDLEQRRLRTFGYAGDPEERLNELAAPK